MNNLQYIKDSNGKPQFVVVPITQFEEMARLSRFGIESEHEGKQWQAIPTETEEADDNVTIPNEVVNIMIDEDVSILGAWRIYRRLSQYDVAEKTGLTQGAISQAERKESKPQRRTLERLAKIYDCRVEQMYL